MSRTFILDLGLFEPRCGSVDWSEQTVLDLLAIVCRANERVIQCGKIPPLYEFGRRGMVRYMPDDHSPFWKKRLASSKEIFMAIPAIIRDGGADCEDLSAWRVAELRMQGERALDERDQFVVRKFQKDDRSLLYHVQVQRLVPSPDGQGWMKGPIEDPSAILGMGSKRDKDARARFARS